MRTFNAPTHDLDVTTVVDELESVMQRVAQRLRFRLGEWFLRTDRGTDYNPILGSFGIDEIAIHEFTAEAASVEDVDSISNPRAVLDGETRVMTYSANVHTRFGTGDLSVEIGG